MKVRRLGGSLATILVAAGVGFVAGNALDRTAARDDKTSTSARTKKADLPDRANDPYLQQSRGAVAENWHENDYGLGDCYGSKLKPYPHAICGDRTPFDIWRYAGKDGSSYGAPTLPMPWDAWVQKCREMKPKLMADCQAYMNRRYDFSGRAIPGVTMSAGKPVMAGPVARLPAGIASWEELDRLSPEEIKRRDIFPYKPLAHPLQSTAHMVFPAAWTRVHPEHERMDVDMDIPDAYLPEFPPPLFLTTHKELGDVTRGREITMGNYWEIFNGLLTPEQMEGLKEMLRPVPSTWFNPTEHRVTYEPSAGVSCLACHVNGHTNGAIELAPDSRPNQARLRVDTPSLRGNYNLQVLSSKRSIRSMDHFAEVEEYFDGDQTIKRALGARDSPKEVSNRMGDFNSIIDFPPAPELDPFGKLNPQKATASELRGEKLFYGKARCVACHAGPAVVDDYMHDLEVERFYVGRPEGPIKTFPLRGIKDSPPYLHDGRCPTLADTVEFFNLVLQLHLTREEKADLVAYMLCL